MTTDKEDAGYLRNIAELLIEYQWSGYSDVLIRVADRLDPPPPKLVTISWEQVAPVMPKKGQSFWALNTEGGLMGMAWVDDKHDRKLWAMGNVFLTEADAKAAAEARKAAVAKVVA